MSPHRDGSSYARRAVIRCDGNRTLGGGHVMRSLTLARGLAAHGFNIGFAVGPDTIAAVPALPSAVAEHNWQLVTLPASLVDEIPAMRAAWPDGTDLAIVDHYSRTDSFERALKPWACVTLAMDDLAQLPHVADFVLDTNIGRLAADYEALVPPSTRVLAGPPFALLRNEFRATAMPARRTEDQSLQRVVLAFGLTDLGAITARVLEVVLDAVPNVHFDCIVGTLGEGRSRLEALAKGRSDVSVHIAPTDVAGIMARSDLALGAGGQMTLERCALGLPTIAVSIADNQLPGLRALASQGGAIVVPGCPAPDLAALRSAYISIAADPARRAELGARARDVCDGHGVGRVIAHILAHPHFTEEKAARMAPPRIKLRPATMADADLLFRWRNDPDTRANSKHTTEVSHPEHVAWLRRQLSISSRVIHIADVDGTSVGTCRAFTDSDVAELSWTVAPTHRGQGVGLAMVKALAASIAGPIRAEVKAGNRSSARIALGAGMTLDRVHDGIEHYVRRAQ